MLRLHKHCLSLNFYPLILASSVDLVWNIYYCGIYDGLYFPLPSTFINSISTVSKSCLFPYSSSIYLLDCYISMASRIFVLLYRLIPSAIIIFHLIVPALSLGTSSHWLLCSFTSLHLILSLSFLAEKVFLAYLVFFLRQSWKYHFSFYWRIVFRSRC